MKQLFFKIAAFSIFSFLVMVSETPSYLKIIFISAMLFFFLPFGNDLFTKERMWRKFIAAVSGTVVFTVLILFVPVLLSGYLTNFNGFLGSGDPFGYSILVFSITLFYFLVYGLPASLLSDWLSARYPHRMAAAGFVHFGFGVLLIGELWVLPVISAIIFWMIDELLQRRTAKELVEI
ncbi:hypothetical protein [Planococcus halotolerans]|uniref:Uncharacterized protein n=1 Tax=Planococcus halotolerans TaxID=2233542 RepID=A0A365L7L3_9BACL|nr:hypothetical protein [Planococcus halotolerans]RAZ81402.1 hypothetical protein DP120_03730 [Planococcus halotolerans]